MDGISKEEVKGLLREVIGGMRDAANPTSDDIIRAMKNRPLKAEKEIECITPDGCVFVAIVSPHSERGNIVKDLKWQTYPANPFPKDWPVARIKNATTGEYTVEAKHLIFEQYTKRWTVELIGKPLPWYLYPDARKAVEEIEAKKNAALSEAERALATPPTDAPRPTGKTK